MLSSNGIWQVLTLHPRERISCWWKNSQLSSLATCAAGWLTGSQLTGHTPHHSIVFTTMILTRFAQWVHLIHNKFPTRKHRSYLFGPNLFTRWCAWAIYSFIGVAGVAWNSWLGTAQLPFFVSRRIVSFLSEAEGCLGGLEVRERHLSEDCEAATSHGVAWEGLLDWIFLRFEQIEQKHVIASIASLQ